MWSEFTQIASCFATLSGDAGGGHWHCSSEESGPTGPLLLISCPSRSSPSSSRIHHEILMTRIASM